MNSETRTQGLVLFAHGARDPRWAAPFERLQKMTQENMPTVHVELAFLELMTPGLPELVENLRQKSVTQITVVPVFLGQGGHVLRDLPAMITSLKAQYPDLILTQVQAVGENELVLNAISHYCVNSIAQ